MQNINKTIAEIMTKRGYHKITAYLPPVANEQYRPVCLCRGVAMNLRQSNKETVEKTAIWTNKHFVHESESVYALRSKNDAGLFNISEWCTDKTVFSGMDGEVVETSIATEILKPVKLPVVAQVGDFNKDGKILIDIVLDPQKTGDYYCPYVYPDKNWRDVRPGYAVIEKVTHKSDACAFVEGHMLKETYRVSLDEFFKRHEPYLDLIKKIRIHGYDDRANTGVIEYWCKSPDDEEHYIDYAVLNDDGTTMKMSFCKLEDTPYKDCQDGLEVTPDEFQLLFFP